MLCPPPGRHGHFSGQRQLVSLRSRGIDWYRLSAGDLKHAINADSRSIPVKADIRDWHFAFRLPS